MMTYCYILEEAVVLSLDVVKCACSPKPENNSS